MAKITVINNGPIRVEGDDIEIYDAQGNRYGLAGRKRISSVGAASRRTSRFATGSTASPGFKESLCQAVEMPPPAAPKPTTIG